MASVRIVRVDDSNYESLPSFEIPLKAFIEIVDESDSEIVFKGAVKHRVDDAYFIVRQGVALYAQFVAAPTWEEFKNQYDKMSSGGFERYEYFSDAFDYGIDSNEVYQKFIESEVYSDSDADYANPQQKKLIYSKYVDYSKSGYKSLSDYDEAKRLG